MKSRRARKGRREGEQRVVRRAVGVLYALCDGEAGCGVSHWCVGAYLRRGFRMANQRNQVIIVDDHPIFRQGTCHPLMLRDILVEWDDVGRGVCGGA